MGTRDALGAVALDLAEDPEQARAEIRRIAAAHNLEVADVIQYRRDERGWIFRILETVHQLGAHAVIVADSKHVEGFTYAVRGVADLIMPSGRAPYSGYGAGHTRPSRVQR